MGGAVHSCGGWGRAVTPTRPVPHPHRWPRPHHHHHHHHHHRRRRRRRRDCHHQGSHALMDETGVVTGCESSLRVARQRETQWRWCLASCRHRPPCLGARSTTVAATQGVPAVAAVAAAGVPTGQVKLGHGRGGGQQQQQRCDGAAGCCEPERCGGDHRRRCREETRGSSPLPPLPPPLALSGSQSQPQSGGEGVRRTTTKRRCHPRIVTVGASVRSVCATWRGARQRRREDRATTHCVCARRGGGAGCRQV